MTPSRLALLDRVVLLEQRMADLDAAAANGEAIDWNEYLRFSQGIAALAEKLGLAAEPVARPHAIAGVTAEQMQAAREREARLRKEFDDEFRAEETARQLRDAQPPTDAVN